jgi:hypothetical protein
MSNYLDVSSHFLHDAIDYEIRYAHCFHSDGPLFYTPRSRRAKSFVDLRMGIESVLKSLICYSSHNDRKDKTLINWIEGFGHNIKKMITKIESCNPEVLGGIEKSNFLKIDCLPVGLRYRLDAWSFEDNKIDIYDETIGSNVWLGEVEQSLKTLIELANEQLKRHGGLVVIDEKFIQEILKPTYEKYT